MPYGSPEYRQNSTNYLFLYRDTVPLDKSLLDHFRPVIVLIQTV